MNWTEVALWALSLTLAVSFIYHIRLRGAIHRLTESLLHPDDATRVDLSRRLLTPVYIRNLARQIDAELQDRSERIALQSIQERVTESMLDQFDDGFIVVDANLTILTANRAACETFARVNGIVGRTVIEAFLDHRIVAVVKRSLEDQTKYVDTFRLEEFRMVKGERMERHLTVESAPLPAPVHGAQGAWIILRDESERYHVEQIRKDFVANASHEIRTPLSIILGYLENLSDGGLADPNVAQRFYGVMTKHAQRLARIVDDMLTISKLEGSSTLLRAEVFDLAESVTDMVEHLHPLIVEKQATVLINLPEEDRSIVGDRFYWDQVFFNLVENALKQNERVGLEIEVRMSSTDREHIVEVVDNGVGIPSTHLPHVFKRFYRVERSHSQNQVKGTGLGLSIVKRAVEAHRGSVAVVSRPGQETIFRITVPKTGVHSLQA
jgi:signal transduction histidine kinase